MYLTHYSVVNVLKLYFVRSSSNTFYRYQDKRRTHKRRTVQT